MKILMFVKFSTQNFGREILFLEVEVFEVTSAFQPPGLECRSITRMNIFRLKVKFGNDHYLEEVDA